ncbi:S8 family serine peptidase [Candidatus Nitrotoga sp. 1052]|uniref:S8 family serine peptidase n=1 Tax=Candidatus Nitrotoga sp. 1052 TaxID=2886964 RepID=UPI001EF72554|nr:S8 family serine peptidase [Candidatus Nitrotoga sp. 1052]CAH1081526.1 Subtilase family protein [Candidatus Nitrotoga sp. 1052]
MQRNSNQYLVSLSFVVFVTSVIGCTTQTKVPEPKFDDGIHNPYGVVLDPLNQVRSASTSKDVTGEFSGTYEIPVKNIYIDEKYEKKDNDGGETRPISKISPVLLEWIGTKNADESVEIIVTFKEDTRIPRLPELGSEENREKGKTRRLDAINKLKRAREESQAQSLKKLAKYGNFKQSDSFWIVNSVVGTVKIGEVKRLSESREVVYLQPVEGGEKPPQDANNNNDAQDGRDRIVSDPYFNLGLTNPWIGLLDTGVRDTHDMFNSPDHIAWMRDCVNGGNNCNDTSNPNFDPTDFSWNHGTSSAGLLTGNNRLGNQYRGVTAINLDSWQIYTSGGLNTAAAVRGIQAGIAAFDKVLVGEIQASESETGTIATAADNAYDAGIIFVSANGNFGPNASTVRSPGIAHKVLGVGGFMTDGGAQYNNQGRGPATDSRYKPDIQAPTWSETASNTNDTALQVFSGTSGATPYAAAAAMLARNWLQQFGSFDNGQTYAFMILYGQREWPYDNTVGAGPIQMATNGHAWWGKVSVGNHVNIDIPINVGVGKSNLDAALWWPESATQTHNDIDVHLIDPSGIERAKGYSGVSIFERTGVNGALQAGTWVIRIRGYNVPTGSQTVYWATHVRN